VVFLLVGDGPEKEVLQNEILNKPYSQQVIFTDAVPNSMIEEYYKAVNLFIQPSYAEGFPRAMLEAMACGLPIVSTDAGGISDVLGNEQKQFMVDKMDRALFADKLLELINDKSAIEKCIPENQEESQKYETKVIAKMYIEKLFSESI